MSKQIDVLAVLDETYGLLAGPAAEQLEEARAAIAELIEAADKYLDDSRLESRLNLIDALKTVQGQQS